MRCRDVTGRALRMLVTYALAVCLLLVGSQTLAQQTQSPLEIGGMSHTDVEGLSIMFIG